jgi:hypothetical protein
VDLDETVLNALAVARFHGTSWKLRHGVCAPLEAQEADLGRRSIAELSSGGGSAHLRAERSPDGRYALVVASASAEARGRIVRRHCKQQWIRAKNK